MPTQRDWSRPGALFVFIGTFVIFSSFHVVRKGYSCSKMVLENQWGIDTSMLGIMDTVFLVSYAMGLIISGKLADRFGAKPVLAIGMAVSIALEVIFGLAQIIGLNTIWFLVVIRGTKGLFNSTGWPCTVKIVSAYFDKRRGSAFGWWCANPWIGNMLGSVLVSALIQRNLSLPLIFSLPASYMLIGLFVLIFLPSHPKDQSHSKSIPRPGSTNMSFSEAIQVPGVASYSLAYSCLKLVEYSLFFWLPIYLHEHICLKCHTSGYVSNAHDVGLILGGIIGGIASDAIGGKRAIVCGSMLVLASGCLIAFAFLGHGESYYTVTALLFASGFCLGGPVVMASSVIAADLAENARKKRQQNGLDTCPEAVGTLNGIICGSGNLGAAAGQSFIPHLLSIRGWPGVFYVLSSFCMLSLAFLTKPILDDIYIKECESNESKPDLNTEKNSLLEDDSPIYDKYPSAWKDLLDDNTIEDTYPQKDYLIADFNSFENANNALSA
ncbi:hypothetical protein AAMO2058_000752100 [Amorphochlora amoebiformis]